MHHCKSKRRYMFIGYIVLLSKLMLVCLINVSLLITYSHKLNGA